MKTRPGRIPDTLFGRLLLILLLSLLGAQALTFGSIWYERSMASRTMMLSYVTRDIASAVEMLERLPKEERSTWLPRLNRSNYRYLLGSPADDMPQSSPLSRTVAQGIGRHLNHQYNIKESLSTDGNPRLDLQLKDGTPLSIEFNPATAPLADWLPALMAAEFVLLMFAAWLAVRIATRPLTQFARAAEALVPGGRGQLMAEAGPSEVARAARSFNAMQERINVHLQERTRILASISHDLQTPITRMRLRAELLGNEERARWMNDLEAMQSLVREGIEYARSAEAPTEPLRKVDVDSLMAALAADYQDAGRQVNFVGRANLAMSTYPGALRRIMTNLVDNALKFAGTATIEIMAEPQCLSLAVLDNGPGIPEDQLGAVLQPFYRLEASRNAETGGSGLGLAIADQLARKCGGHLSLSNRVEGGLSARLLLTPDQIPH